MPLSLRLAMTDALYNLRSLGEMGKPLFEKL